MEDTKENEQKAAMDMEVEQPDGEMNTVSSGALNGADDRLSQNSKDAINNIMKEEQNEFAYDNMDKGSNKSFQAEDDEEENKERVMDFNMDQLI